MNKKIRLIWHVLLPMFLIKSNFIECGILYPKPSETRETISLDGIWNFIATPISDPLAGFRNYWYKKDLTTVDAEVHLMPVPSSYNDITQNPTVRDHLGIVWYDRSFFVPKSWEGRRVWLRFSAVHYAAQIYVNGELAMNHEVGHLPFQKEITWLVKFGSENKVTVACDNTLLSTTVPQGTVAQVDTDNGTTYLQKYTFDFFNYAGIHRPVTLFSTPLTYIDDITIGTSLGADNYAYVSYNLSVIYSDHEEIDITVSLLDKDGVVVAICGGLSGNLTIVDPILWWPYLMDPEPGYLYTLKVELVSVTSELIDIYRQPVGIRTLTWTNSTFLINNRPLYLHGFGRHEDSDIRGKGFDLPTTLRDYNLIKWIGGNAYRTSHYPYADEIMDLADKLGVMIIDECPSVNTEIFSASLLQNHKNSLSELIARDKNRPSVIAWSIANEPRTQTSDAGVYFGKIAAHVRSLDLSRPITIALSRSVNEDYAGKHLDIISFNRYNAWYINPGQLDMIKKNVINEATAWFEKYNKPVLMSEYGADTMEGLHIYPAFIWSEEFQVKVMSKHFEAFDALRQKGFFVGEFIWNFADFKTAQEYTRVGGNKKGIFTRNREPKASAHHLRRRYLKLANELYKTELPDDLYDYTSKSMGRDEL